MLKFGDRVRWEKLKFPGIVVGASGLLLCGYWWAVLCMPGNSYHGEVPPFSEVEKATAARLHNAVEMLAEKIGERNLGQPAALGRAKRYLFMQLSPWQRRFREQTYEVHGTKVSNLELAFEGVSPETVVVGAHYDSAVGTPGANDNASGVAVLLELARRQAKVTERRRRLHLVWFVNEEPPYFQTNDMGSVRYAHLMQEEERNVVAMLSLETMGYYTDLEETQKYPAAAKGWFPSVGNFLAVVGNTASKSLVEDVVGEFRRTTKFPSEGLAMSAGIQGLGWSDHWSFWQIGVPAAMVTDTAPFRYLDYHRPSDTIDEIDFERLARVTDGLEAVLEKLVGGGQSIDRSVPTWGD